DSRELPSFPTRRSSDLWVQVRTPAFKAWFGDFELANLERSMRRVRGSDQAKAVRGDIVGKPLTNVETGIVATVSGGSWGKMMSRSEEHTSELQSRENLV